MTSPVYGGEPVLASDLDNAPDTLELAGLERKFEAVSHKVASCVVSISAACSTIDSADTLRTESLNHERLEGMLERTTRMVGTGFIIDPDGYILTNEHVVGEGESVWITTDDRKVYPAIVVGSDPRSDLAVLKVPVSKLPAVRFAAYNSAKRGQWAIAMGNPYGLATEGEQCMSVGIISAVERSLPKLSKKENRLYSNLIQTTAQINPGNSGGPLFNLNGEVIGINTAVILPEKRTNGIGFAMPITADLMRRVHDLKEGNEIVYGYMGVMVSTPTAMDRQAAGLKEAVGVHVDGVEPDSPASEANKIKANDVIVEINGEMVRDSDHVRSRDRCRRCRASREDLAVSRWKSNRNPTNAPSAAGGLGWRDTREPAIPLAGNVARPRPWKLADQQGHGEDRRGHGAPIERPARHRHHRHEPLSERTCRPG